MKKLFGQGVEVPMPALFMHLALAWIANKLDLCRCGPRLVEVDVSRSLGASPIRWCAAVREIRITQDGIEIDCVRA